MKQSSTKPMFAVELFSMMQDSARDCSDSIPKDQLTLADIASCAWEIGGGASVFVVDDTCTLDGEQMGFACYNNPSEGNYIFRS